MPDTEQQHHQRCIAYLVEALQSNPMEQGAAIIDRRSRLLGLQQVRSPGAETYGALGQRQRRQATLRRLEQVRANFWVMPLDALQRELAELKSEFPDLRAAVDRLNVVAAQRAELPKIVDHRHFDSHFFSVFKEVLVSPPKEVALAKERLLVAFANSKNRRRGTKMIRLVKRQLPAVYELEATWMELLVKQRPRYKKVEYASRINQSGGDFAFGGTTWFVMVLIAVVISVIIAMSIH
jgi:hypothetical protein